MSVKNLFLQLYFKTTGYSFTHMGRLFLRMFVGLMIAQFGVRQLIQGPEGFDTLPFLASGLPLWLIIVVELVCPFCFMIGFFTRIMIIPPFVLMIISAHHVVSLYGTVSAFSVYMLSVPFLFMGILMFLLLVGPGKISADYFLSLYLINKHKGKEEDLEEV